METKEESTKALFEQRFLPYLWGMETSMSAVRVLTEIQSSYRTYEEWKQSIRFSMVQGFVSSYRTYEEWKLQKAACKVERLTKFLPYLWGMETPKGRV